MSNQQVMLTNGLGGLGNSLATIQDLNNLLLPRDSRPASIVSRRKVTPSGLLLSGKTIIYQVTVDSEISAVQTFTFPANYTTLDQAINDIQIDSSLAINDSGKVRIYTIKKGYNQGLFVFKEGTANPLLNFDNLMHTNERGTGSLTDDFSDDEKIYALVKATYLAYSYLRRRYAFPLKSWSMDLIDAVCAIAAYSLIFREGYSPEPGSYDANWRKRYEDAIQWLSDVGNRKIHPVIEGASKPVPKANDGSISTDPRGWRIAMGLCDTEAV